ncbi:hypothetical protein [Vibrio sp. SCSIO 43137]|uniref:hypothetical protein n=1 Tax=Vibrio sp. SCSIO 43137 TaxID=3021011 RepID=UPI00230774A6|nr:hypothetical protein [Vibrio sp. SCSIO 43137]WCE30754.1 hypothetical protein PK654_05630 [Vibrio sp. SCSIO 43137]
MSSSSLNNAIQASFQKHFNRALIQAVTESVTSGKDSLDPNLAIKAMELALEENGVSKDAVDAVALLKTDQKVIEQFDQFDKVLSSDEAPSSASSIDQDKFSKVQLNNSELSNLVNSLKQEADYKTHTAIGKTVKGVASSGWDLKGKWGEFKDASRALNIETELSKALEEFDNLPSEYKTDSFEKLFAKRHPPVEIELDGKIITKTTLSPKQKALNRIQNALDQSDSFIKEMNVKNAPGQDLLSKAGKYGKKVWAVGGPLTTAGGGVYTAVWAQDNVDKIHDLYEKGIISESEYKARKAQFDLMTASGALTITSGVVEGSKTIATQIVKHTSKGVANTAAKNFVKIAPGIGDMLAIGMSSVSLAKNAIAADQARKSGNTGRTAVYGTMAALDGVNVVLNSVALALEFVPGAGTALSFAVNMVSVAVEFIKSTIEHFSKLFDNRTEAEKVNEKFTQLVESDAFKKHVDVLADDFKKQGYDIFEYVVDSQSAGVEGSDSAHDKVPVKKVLRLLSDGMFKKSFDELKKAYVDTSYKDGDYHGMNGDDLIQILGGGNRNLYGEGGDDIIIDAKGNSKLDGGKGNDYLDGGAGVDEFYGGDGDDIVNFQPAIDKSADGGAGKDTLKVNFGNGDHISLRSGQMQHQLGGVHLDLENKQAGVGLGKDCIVDTAKYSASAPSNLTSYFTGSDGVKASAQLESLMSRGSSSIGSYADLVKATKGHQLWQLANTGNGVRYYTDGERIYKQNADGSVHQGQFSIKGISDSVVSWSGDHRTANVSNGNEVEALLYLSFSSTDWVKNFENGDVQLSGSSLANIYGDSQDNMIRIGSGGFAAVDARDGNDTIVLEADSSHVNDFHNNFIYKNAIQGGDGYDSLVLKNINTNHDSLDNKYHAYYLVDHGHKSLSEFGQFYGHSYGNKNYRMVAVDGIESVVLDDSAASGVRGSTTLDASALGKGMTYVTNLERQADIVTSKHDDKVKVNSAADGSQFRSSGGQDILDFGGYQKGAVKVNLENGQIHGSLTGLVHNFDNVFASRYSGDVLTGSSRSNTLVAQGGSDTLFGMGGDDHLVSRQGTHTLIGGEGSDLYTVMGPVNSGSVSIVAQADSKGKVTIMVDFGQGMKTLQPGKHNLNVLGVDKSALTLLSGLTLKDSAGKDVSNNGLISVVDNQLVINTQGHFANLKANEKVQLSAGYESAGSVTRIDESGINNVLRLGGIKDINDIQFALDKDNNLVIKNKQGQDVIVDVQFGREFSAGKTTLAELSSNFVKRFPQINLLSTQKNLDMAQFNTKLSTFVNSLKGHELAVNDRIIQSQSKQATINSKLGDDIIVADGFAGNSVDRIDAGAGDDIILANRKWKGRTSYDNPVSTTIVAGAGSDTVVLGDDSRSVFVDFTTGAQEGDRDTLVLNYADMKDIAFMSSGDRLSDVTIVSRKTFRSSFIKGMPAKLAIKANGNTYITDNAEQISNILTGNTPFSPSGFTHYLDKDGNPSLNLESVNSNGLKVWMGSTKDGLHVRLQGNSRTLASFDFSEINHSYINRADLIKGIAADAQGSLKFGDKTLTGKEVHAYLQTLLSDSSKVHLEPGLTLTDKQVVVEQPVKDKGKEEQLRLTNASFENGNYRYVQDWLGTGGVSSFSDRQKINGHGSKALRLSGGQEASHTLHHELIDTSADYKLKINIAHETLIKSTLSIRLLAGHTVVGAVTFSPEQYWDSMSSYWKELEVHIDGSNLKGTADQNQKLTIEIVQGKNIYPSQGGEPVTVFDNVRLSKLTGAMATFDKDATSADGSSTRGTTYTFKSLIAPPQV